MKKLNMKNLIGIAIALMIVMQTAVTAQTAGQLLLNEVENDPPPFENGCQYAEIRGANPGGTVPTGTYFISLDSNASNPGFLNTAVNFGGSVVGSNGTITLQNTLDSCPNRTFPTGTTVVNYFSGNTIGGNLPGGLDSENYLVVRSTTTLFSGQDVDTNDDGIIDPALGVTVIDGAAYNINPEELFVYGGVPTINDVPFSDVPDAFVRFSNNNTPFAKAAFYYGELAASPEETTEFAAPLSPNFPVGGRLTPGAPNVGSITATKRLFDFDGDNRDDISVFRPDGGVWYLLNSTSGFTAAQFGLSTDRLVPGDYDGDGRAELAVWRPSTSTWFFAPVTNSSPSTQFTTFQFGEATDIPVPADYDGDGRTNLAVFRPSINTWYILNTARTAFTTTTFGQTGDRLVPADYNGDGRVDIAVYRPSINTWFILDSPAGFRSIQFGSAGDRLVPADYDGDGRADIAVFRNGTWFYLQSGNNNAFTSVNFGVAGDIPVPGYYDGDGRADIAVFRNGTWFYLSSANNNADVTTQFGVSTDRAIPAAYQQQQ